ncbi:MAG TPA: hypothetical protein VJX67_15445 [Blastocatellia bacterium]|nr:hypothetical protein [Blastocatellia bacterium]
MHLSIPEAETETGLCLPSAIRNARGALVVAHPGHELRLHGWLELAQPVVYIFTDGSGHTARSRLETTTRLVLRAGAKPGSLYGRFTDIEIYTAILNRDLEFFIRLTEELAEALVREDIQYVVGDAVEGYNPTHDICRAVIDSAIDLAAKAGKRIANFEFTVVGARDSRDDGDDAFMIRLHLDQGALDRKMASADAYSELRDDIAATVNAIGSTAFQIETFCQVTARQTLYAMEAPPFYERYGEKQVKLGHYRESIRYHEHVLPITNGIRNRV